jgi:hypothetical protein
MVMCAIYAVCKVHPGPQIQFNHIINKYTEMFKSQRSIIHVYM